MFRALVVDQRDGQAVAELSELDESSLPDGDTLVRVEYSTMNYKDALALRGKNKVLRSYPMVPGIDFAGVVEQTSSDNVAVGDRVVLTGFEVGEVRFGGLAEYARVPGDWLVPLGDRFTTEQAMVIGTAGFTAMLAVLALEAHGIAPSDGDVLVTGAAGGVGSVSVALLAKLGYRVIASTGRTHEKDYLTKLGAAEIIDRAELSKRPKPLERGRWIGAIDSVGSDTLATVLAATLPGGTVAACGLAQGMDLATTVAPFILRGITLAGINSVFVPLERRKIVWSRLARDLDLSLLSTMETIVGLADVSSMADQLLSGKIRGRLVVDVTR